MNSYIINSFNNQLKINSTKEDINIFTLEKNKGNDYLPSAIRLDCSAVYHQSVSDDVNVYVFQILDKEIFSFSDLVFSFTVPEIYSKNQIAYVPWFGYKLIKKVRILEGDNEIISVDGVTLFSRAYKKNKDILHWGGYSKDLNNFNVAESENLVDEKRYYLPKKTIHISIDLLEQDQSTFTSFKNFQNSKLSVEIHAISDLKEVMVYNPDVVFNDVYSKEKKDLSIEVPVLDFIGYTTNRHHIDVDPAYVYTHKIGESSFGNPTEVMVSNIDTISSIHWSIYNDLSGKRFVSYPGYNQTEKDYIDAFLNKIINDLVVIVEDQSEIDELGFPKKSKFIKVVDNKVKLSSKTVNIYIENVPTILGVYYHTNILSHKAKKNEISYNISEKFNLIHGRFNPLKKSIEIIHIDHTIDITDVSIPVELWQLNTNTDDGDNRRESNKLNDIIINDPMLRGIDLINKTNPIEMIMVKHGSEIIFEAKDTIQYFLQAKLKQEIKLPGLVLSYGGMTFNKTSDPNIIESYLLSDHIRGKNSVKIEVVYKKIAENTPNNLIQKGIVVNCVGVGFICNYEEQNVLRKINSR